MSSQPSVNPSADAQLLERLAAKRKQIGYGLIIAGVLFGKVVGIINAVLYKDGSLTTLLWAVFIGILLVALGVVHLLVSSTESAETAAKPANQLRMLALGVAAGLGLLTAMYGVALALSSPPRFAQLDYPKIFAGGIKAWRDPENGFQNAWALGRCLAAIVFGLVLMFAGLQLARTFERTSQGLRRLLYGYNAVLSSLLLGFILLLINVMSYSNVWPFKALGRTYDWTGAHIYSLSESTENLLTNLKEPVTVYLIMSGESPFEADAEMMLNTARQHTDQLSWEALSPEVNFNRIVELAQKYRLSNPRGMLVVYGREPNHSWDFTPEKDLVAPDPNSQDPRSLSYIFKGEEHLQKALVYLSQNKTKTVVYFTQGHGEPDLNSQSRERERGGVGGLVTELRKRNYDIRELKLGPTKHEVPADADIVVIIDPQEGYRPDEEKALRDYLQGKGASGKKGHLLFLAGLHVANGRVVRTGLEGLLRDQGVTLQDDRLLVLGAPEELMLNVAGRASTQSNNPVARSFSSSRGAIDFVFEDTRTVEKVNNPAGGPVVEPLMATVLNQALIRQTELGESPRLFLRDLERRPQERDKRLLQDPVSLALAVSEGNPLANIPGHESMGGEGVRPRMVVFGDAKWVSNSWLLESKYGPDHIDLFASCLAWLRERPDIGATVTTHSRQLYKMNAGPGAGWRLILLPITLLLTAVLAMGLGVWVIRRR